MSHQKSITHSSILQLFDSKFNRNNHIQQKQFSTISIRKKSSDYKKYDHDKNLSKEIINFFPKKITYKCSNQLHQKNKIQQPQKKLLLFKRKQDQLAFYQEKYNQQVNHLSSNLYVKKIEKQNPGLSKHQRKSSFQIISERKKNLSIQAKDFKIPQFKSLKRKDYHQYLIKIDQNYKIFKQKHFSKPHNKLKFNTKLKPLQQIKDLNMNINLKQSFSLNRDPQKSQNIEKHIFSQQRNSYLIRYKKSLMNELLTKQDIKPWQNKQQEQQENINDQIALEN